MTKKDDGETKDIVQKHSCCCKILSETIVGGLEWSFSVFGRFIGRNPLPVIASSLIICLLFFVGLKDIREEKRVDKLWLPPDSQSVIHERWFAAHYPPEVRMCGVVVENENILSPSSLDMLCRIDEELKRMRVMGEDGIEVTWSNTCFSPTMNGICSPSTILQVWGNNCTLARKLDQVSASFV